MSGVEGLFLFVMLQCATALGWAVTRHYYKGRIAELVDAEVERIAGDYSRAADEYAELCLRAGREQGRQEMAQRMILGCAGRG
jgi:hypothetical protein